MFSVSNKHEEFFDYLIANAENFHNGALICDDVMKDVKSINQKLPQIESLEEKADQINAEVIMKLCKVFITPIDREDFYKLTCALEDCIDPLHGALIRVNVYHVTQNSEAATEISARLVDMGEEMKKAFALLKSIDKNEAELMERANNLSKLESEIDDVYRRELSRLFNGDVDILDVVRWKDILETLEEAADNVEELANAIKEVTMKYA